MNTANSSPSVCSAAALTPIDGQLADHGNATTSARVLLGQDLTGIMPATRHDSVHPTDSRTLSGDLCPSSASVGKTEQHEAREELAKLYPKVHEKLLAGKHASLARHASAGFEPAETCIKDFAVVEQVFDLLSIMLEKAPKTAGSASVSDEFSRLSASILGLQKLYEDTVAKAAKLCDSAYLHHQKHGSAKLHATRAVYAGTGGKLEKSYAQSARLLATAIEKATTDLQKLLGGDHAKARWGEFLFDALVDHVVVPGIGSRRGCSVAEAWKHVDSRKLIDYRDTCGWLRSSMHNDPIAFLAMHLGQAYYIVKSPPTDGGGSANGGPDYQRADSPNGRGHQRDDSPPSGDASPFGSDTSSVGGHSSSAPSQHNAALDGDTPSITSEFGHEPLGGVNDTHRPASTSRSVEGHRSTRISIVGDINITIHMGRGGRELGTDHCIELTGNNGLAIPGNALYARLETARAAVNSAIDLAQQRSGAYSEPKTQQQAHRSAAPTGTELSFSSVQNGGGRLFSFPEGQPRATTSFHGLGNLSNGAIAPESTIDDVSLINDQSGVETGPVVATSQTAVSPHSGPRLFLDVDTSKPLGGLQSPLTLEHFPGLLSSRRQSSSSAETASLRTEPPDSNLASKRAGVAFSIQPWAARVRAPVVIPQHTPVPVSPLASVPEHTSSQKVREPGRAVDFQRARRTRAFREVSQTPMQQVSTSVKSVQETLLAQLGKIETSRHRTPSDQSSETSRSSLSSGGSSLEGGSGVFGRPRLAQPKATQDPGRFTASRPSGSGPSTYPTLIATNLGRQFDVRSSHLKAANPTQEMLSQWQDGAPMPVSEIRSA